MTVFIPFEQGEAHLDWLGLCDALEAGHQLPKASIGDLFLTRDGDTLLTRSAVIDGLGIAVKAATVFPRNSALGLPSINGAVNVFDNVTGALRAVVDFHLITKWKTAGDSLLAARKLARPDSRRILILGAGTVAGSLIQAYSAGFPGASFTVWARDLSKAQAFAAQHGAQAAPDLAAAVAQADIITSATMTTEPILHGDWLQPGQHVDLIGAYRPDMREADDRVLERGRVFVDSRDTTLEHIGELKIPLASAALAPEDIVADYYQFGDFKRSSKDEITVFKNGGGAHLDLMTACYILDCWSEPLNAG